MNEKRYAIVVVAYNRPKSLARLLNSLEMAIYNSQAIIDLVVSVDKADNQDEVANVADSIVWEKGAKIVRKIPKRLGLRKHVLYCGDIVNDYDGIVMLEDDITVSFDFFNYAEQALNFYSKDDRVAGISLYAHRTAFPSMRAFTPCKNGYDAFFLQYAQSWGQCWSKSMWINFREWYERKETENAAVPNCSLIPHYIYNWGEASWLKYFMWYLAERDLFFVYPYFSHSTNHSEAGTHRLRKSHDYMVPLSIGSSKYRFPKYDNSVHYDMFFERLNLKHKIQEISQSNVCIDLYGTKSDFGTYDFLISTEKRDYKLVREIELKHRPHELNLLYPEEGKGIMIYDVREPYRTARKVKKSTTACYDLGPYSWKMAWKYCFVGLCESIQNRLNGVLRNLRQ